MPVTNERIKMFGSAHIHNNGGSGVAPILKRLVFSLFFFYGVLIQISLKLLSRVYDPAPPPGEKYTSLKFPGMPL